MTEAQKNIFEYTVEELRMAKEQLRWRDATKEVPEERLYVIARTKSKFYEPHSGRAFWDIVLTYIRDGEWQDIDTSYEVMEWLPIPKEKV